MPRKTLNVPIVKTALPAQTDVSITGKRDTAAAATTARPGALRRAGSAGEGALGSLLSAATRQARARKAGSADPATPATTTVSPAIDAALRAWVGAAPEGERFQRKAISRLIAQAAAEKSPDLRIAGLQVTSLPDCIDQLPLKNLTIIDCGLPALPRLPPNLDSLIVSRYRLPATLDTALKQLHKNGRNMKTHEPELPDTAPYVPHHAEEIDGWDLLSDAAPAPASAAHVEQWQIVAAIDDRTA
ncbi:MAG: hypothetical protein H7234_03335 [Herminiimonas sp.]|nr:hypothetical protein [Herminiimonas sp.]